MSENFFDSAGNWIAFRKEQFFYAPSGAWLGWVPDASTEVFDTEGIYLGTIYSNRIFRSLIPSELINSAHPGYPGRQAPADHPGFPGRCDLPATMEDIGLLEHV